MSSTPTSFKVIGVIIGLLMVAGGTWRAAMAFQSDSDGWLAFESLGHTGRMPAQWNAAAAEGPTYDEFELANLAIPSANHAAFRASMEPLGLETFMFIDMVEDGEVRGRISVAGCLGIEYTDEAAMEADLRRSGPVEVVGAVTVGGGPATLLKTIDDKGADTYAVLYRHRCQDLIYLTARDPSVNVLPEFEEFLLHFRGR